MGPGENDDGAEDASAGVPVPKDDRLWRHPSELADAPQPEPEAPRRTSRWRFKRHA